MVGDPRVELGVAAYKAAPQTVEDIAHKAIADHAIIASNSRLPFAFDTDIQFSKNHLQTGGGSRDRTGVNHIGLLLAGQALFQTELYPQLH